MIKSNKQLELAYNFIELTKANLFLTGKAGTGKTTFLRSLHLRISKQIVVCAPTGVAALNAGGVTLHSLFQLSFLPHIPESERSNGQSSVQIKKFSKSKLSLIRSIELLVIDEISMVRSDTLDAVDETLRQIRRSQKPFGGVQLLMIGDVNQLSPIIRDDEKDILSKFYNSQYFFDSMSLKKCSYITIELEKIYRQNDTEFTSILNDIRERRISYDSMARLNKRYIEGFNPDDNEGYIRLTTHNSVATQVNEKKLRALKGDSIYFHATVKGDFPENIYPNDETLELKVGANVIFIKNDSSSEKLYYNGMRGKIIDFSDSSITVQTNDKAENIEIYPETWDNVEYRLNSKTSEIDEFIKGTFSQFPLKCAWAITIHKSQGLTFDKAIVDINSAFAYGQVYVALSRIRSLEGVVLSSPLKISSIIGSNQVDNFNDYIKNNQPDNNILNEHKKQCFENTLIEIFDFSTIKTLSYTLLKILTMNLSKSYPQLVDEFKSYMSDFNASIISISTSFHSQIKGIIINEDYETSLFLKQRIQKGAEYFNTKLERLYLILDKLANIDIDAKDIRRQFNETFSPFKIDLYTKKLALELCIECFDIREYSKIKARVIANDATLDNQFKTKTKELSKDVIHPKLYNEIIEWRASVSAETSLKPSSILPLKSIVQIQATLPCTLRELKKITGIGEKTIKSYADDLLSIISEFCVSSDIDPVRDGFTSLVFHEITLNEDNTIDTKTINTANPTRKKSHKEKPEKTPTYITTYEMLNSGLSIQKIAEKREFTKTTIESHIVKLIELKLIDSDTYISKSKLATLTDIVKSHTDKRLGEIKEIVGDTYTYFELKIALTILNK